MCCCTEPEALNIHFCTKPHSYIHVLNPPQNNASKVEYVSSAKKQVITPHTVIIET